MDEMSSDEAVRNWLEHHIGPLRSFERQPRWRPAWFADIERDGAVLPLYVRADREGLQFSLSTHREADILEALENRGIPVPHIHGRIEAPKPLTTWCAPCCVAGDRAFPQPSVISTLV